MGHRQRSEEFVPLKDKVTIVTKRLAALRTDIDSIVHNVSVGTGVVQAISKALEFGGECFV